MYRFFDMGLEAGVAAVVLVPLFLVVNRFYFHDLGRTMAILFSPCIWPVWTLWWGFPA